MTKFDRLSKAKFLSTLLALPLPLEYGVKSILTDTIVSELLLKVGGCLQVLSLSQSNIVELADPVGELKYLKYLDLSYTKVKELPSSIGTLYNLQTLLLSNCKNLIRLPTNLCRLINLRHLVISCTPLKEMPPQMCKLRNLRTLSDFVQAENGGSRIKELGELHSLHGSLCISGLENVVEAGDVFEADLKNKKYLADLSLRWKYGKPSDDSIREREVLNALKPHIKLKKLKIEGYRGTIFPDWVATGAFVDMIEVSLCDCHNCCLLPPWGQLASLRKLEIGGMHGLESIGDEFCGTSLTKSFPSLDRLSLGWMDSLENWSFTGAKRDGEIFPRLKRIDLDLCNKLKVGLPTGCFPSLETIEIRGAKEMVSILPTLSQVEIDNACPSVGSVSVSMCPRLESFLGFPSNLKNLDIAKCPTLIANRTNSGLQRLDSLQCLGLMGCEFELVVDSFPEEGLLPSSLTSLNIWSFRNLRALNGSGFQHLTSLQYLTIWDCKELECLPEGRLPLSLILLRINYCTPLLHKRCQRQTGVYWPKIQHIPNIEIDSTKI